MQRDRISRLEPRSIANDLASRISGDVLFEDWQRAMYAFDASPYFVMPLCIAIPKSKEDVVEIVRYASENRIPITARGGGSSLCGQSIGEGIIIDFSRYMNRIIEINTSENYVVVEPGVYKRILDVELLKYGKIFPPDPSSYDFCTIGGMIGTNASGPHTVKYGTTIDYILSLEVVLSTGEIIEARRVKLDSYEWNKLVSSDTQEAKIYRAIRRIVEENKDAIASSYPNVKKNSCGYRLDRVLEDGYIDLGKLFAASEGTLGIITSAKLRILDAPRCKGILLLSFKDLISASHAVKEALKFNPSAIEMLESSILDAARPLYPEIDDFIPTGTAVAIYVEVDGEDEEDVMERISKIKRIVVDEKKLSFKAVEAFDEKDINLLWTIRKKSLGFMYKAIKDGRKAHLTFVEDVVVPIDRIPDFIAGVQEILRKYGLEAMVSGHAGDGNIHIRPLVNVRDEKDFRIVPLVASEIFNLAKAYGGSISGEHGDGMLRAGYVRFQYGERLYKLFEELKNLFDPLNIMNPGKKLGSNGLYLERMKSSPSWRPIVPKTMLSWSGRASKLRMSISGYASKLSFIDELELCLGCGLCRGGALSGTTRMCPVFAVENDELASCRGRVNILRWIVSSDSIGKDFVKTDTFKKIVYENCVQCRMCLLECLANADIGKIMAEARSWYVHERGIPKGYRFFIEIDRYAKLGVKFSPIANWILRNKLARILMEYAFGIDRRRNLPPFAKKTFEEIFKKHEGRSKGSCSKSVVFFYDTYINYNDPELGMAIVKILEMNGFNVIVPPQMSSGLPAINEGALEIAKEIAKFNISNLAPYAKRGVPIVCFSPAASLALKHEYIDILDDENSIVVSENTYDLYEFLYDLYDKGMLRMDLNKLDMDILVHLHCHTKVQRLDSKVIGLLELIPGLKVSELEKGCCGSGGAFSFVKGNFERSLKIGSRLFRAVMESDRPVYTTGELCRLQIEAGSGKRIGLVIDLVRKAYGV